MMFTLIRQNSGSYTRHLHPTQSVSLGFTLIELLITITILGILAAIVIPSYNAQIRKGSRSDAVTGLLRAAQDLERCHSTALTYNDATCTDYTGGILSERLLYTIATADINGNADQNPQSFTLRALPVAGTSQANDDECAVFTLDHTGLRFARHVDGATDTTLTCWR